MVEVEGTGEPLAPEVPGDRHRAGIEAAGGELGAQRDDPLAHLVRRPAGAGERPARARLEGVEPALTVAAEQALEMLTAEPVRGRGGGDGQLPGDDLEDGDPMLRHAPDCHACPDSPVAYHLSPMSWTQTPSSPPLVRACGRPGPPSCHLETATFRRSYTVVVLGSPAGASRGTWGTSDPATAPPEASLCWR